MSARKSMRRVASFSLFVLVFWSALALAPAKSNQLGLTRADSNSQKTNGLKLDKADVASGAIRQVRVRIFPHRRDYLPHGIDKIQNRFRLQSEEPCRVYAAHASKTQKIDRLLLRSKSIYLNAERLRSPVWVECEKPVTLERPSSAKNYAYVGSIYVRSVVDSSTRRLVLQAVNVLPLERYLEGVVPSEIQPSWPMEALKSQAVAARTYSVYHITYARKYSRHPDFDVDDSIVFQVYTGISEVHKNTNQAIAATAGQILMFNDTVIQAFYHADSGGYTAGAQQMFATDAPYCEAKKELQIVGQAASRWQKLISISELNASLIKRKLVASVNPVVEVHVPLHARTENGRVLALTLFLKNGTTSELPITSFKRSFPLNSLLFDLKNVQQADDGSYLVLSGRGMGHGVGLNQKGAKDLAAHYRWPYQKILSFYYSRTNLCQIDQELVADVPQCSKLNTTKQWAGL